MSVEGEGVESDCGEANKVQVGHLVTWMPVGGICKVLQKFLIVFRFIRGVI